MTEAGWAEPSNARMYDEYTRTFPGYRSGSERLVRHAGIPPGARVLDLACGTGITTAEILRVLDDRGRVLAVDRSGSMLSIARDRITDSRVIWLQAAAEELGSAVAGPVDLILCHSALWHFDLQSVAPALRKLLAPGGRFVCNSSLSPARTSDPSPKPGLYDLMRAYAVIDHDFVFRPDSASRPVSTAEAIDALRAAGFEVESTEVEVPPRSFEDTAAWMRIPVFTEHWTGLTYDQRMDALNKACNRVDRSIPLNPRREALITARVRAAAGHEKHGPFAKA